MSFDRVLPRPPALYETASRCHKPSTSSLLEHKIMNDRSRAMSIEDMSRPSLSMRKLNDSESCSTALSQMQLSSINREKLVENNHLQPNFTTSPKQNTPGGTVELTLGERSASDSPTKLESAKEAASQFCLCQPDPKIPRPRNAFILYRQHYQAAVVAQNPGLANPEISKIIGEQWRALPIETKEEWKALAEAEKARHQQQYPDYRYQPRRFGRDNYVRNASMSAGSSMGPTICNRCGGRLMNPPSTPHTPLTATIPSMSSRSSQPESTSSHNSSIRGGSRSDRRRSSSLNLYPDSDRRVSHSSHSQWKESDTDSADSKRRRLNSSTFHRTGSPDTEAYSLSSQKTYVSRPGVAYFRSHVPRQPERDPNLTLPPLKGNDIAARNQTDTVMSIPVLNKIKVLTKISPPLSERNDSPPRGVVVAVDGQDPTQVKIMLKHLGRLLSYDNKFLVRVFEGPDILTHQSSSSSQMGDATVDYLNVISAWHRISDDITQFVGCKQSDNESKDSSRTGTPQSETKTERSPSPLGTNADAIPVALVPRYQLTTADAFACAIPINDRYAFLEHWQWMASLWRACVGPDVTVHIRECERDEIERHGSGNPVEVRLNEARTLIVRRLPDPSKDIEEKALRRVGFELEDFITR
ncbi:hypothetical protein BGW36DRAFT_427627 [Talaromyces proteolyticus]|uniref:HMG box domain-containing protein n=1 Tax=Talaromyces proteolyticus TaxID=1131652 RepID=A0AAD4KPU4_9EURO|nr:uncharacterized protein BGW36DRAFT_427627 [Talaromyces proteolyticus]KAH8697672.1 hypothetical protein BGW36DRAFT_427627 [Talaromyces proteolyticus]